MLKFLRNFIARDVHSHFDIAIYFIAGHFAASFLDNGGNDFYALLIMLGMIFVGIYLQVLFTGFIDARLKAKAEKEAAMLRIEESYEEAKQSLIRAKEKLIRPLPPTPPPARPVTGKPPKRAR